MIAKSLFVSALIVPALFLSGCTNKYTINAPTAANCVDKQIPLSIHASIIDDNMSAYIGKPLIENMKQNNMFKSVDANTSDVDMSVKISGIWKSDEETSAKIAALGALDIGITLLTGTASSSRNFVDIGIIGEHNATVTLSKHKKVLAVYDANSSIKLTYKGQPPADELNNAADGSQASFLSCELYHKMINDKRLFH